MFGYIKPVEDELLVKELRIYKGIYCSLCRTIGKHFGVFSRIFLGYECTFLSIIALSRKKTMVKIKSGKCVVNWSKKCNFCTNFEEDLKFSGAVSILLAYYKIIDDVKDSKNIIKKIRYKIILCIVKFSYKKIAKIYPKLNLVIKKQLKKQEKLENNEKATIDESSEPSAKILSHIFGLFSSDNKDKRILEQFGFFVGKWIYLVDAVDDFSADIKNKNFNPFIISQMRNKNIKKYANEILNQVLYQIFLSYNLLETKNLNGLLNNIVKLGLKKVQHKVLDKMTTCA
ncbi:MAG: DUF5685 family protein [Oscillospiraceae bacterium]|jgi:hypothetical protein|nr:DUF5685 family protein [Oscillospiraceae bacterium]